MFSRSENKRFEPYLDRIYGYALAMSRDGEVAAELVQDCVLRVLKARNIPCDEDAYRSWLFTIVRNLWRDHLRSTKRQQHVEPNVEGNWFADLSPVGGPTLGPYKLRSEALQAEKEYLNDRLA